MTSSALAITNPAHAAPLALGLTGWPARPPKFDAVSADSTETLRIPVTACVGSSTAPPASNGRACQVMLFDGRRVEAVETTADSLESPATPTDEQPPGPQASGDLTQWIDRFVKADVCANRRGSPDLLAQLHSALRRPVDTVICSVLDAEPAACVLNAIAAAHPADLLAGVKLLARVCGVARSWIAIDNASPSSWWNSLRADLRGSDVRMVELENDYPQADPTLLLYSLTGRRLRPGRLPAELGVLVIDAATAVAIGAAAVRGEKQARQSIVVRDHDHLESYFVDAPVGMSAAQILSAVSLPSATGEPTVMRSRILRGGDVLRDLRLMPDAVVGGGSEIVLHVSTETPPVNPDPCIRCAWCFEACPTRIQPANLLEAAQRNDPRVAQRAGIGACIECGICTYVCPSKLPILAGIRALKRSTP